MVDGGEHIYDTSEDHRFCVKKSTRPVLLVQLEHRRTFYQTINQKLLWGVNPPR